MRRVLKSLVLWLMLVAIPVQAYATATLMCCGLAHTERIENSSHVSAGMMGEHGHHQQLTQDHDHETSMVVVASNYSTHHHNEDGTSKRAALKCSACAACCVGVAITSNSVFSFGFLRLDSIKIVFLPSYFYGFIPETLERPPYPLIA